MVTIANLCMGLLELQGLNPPSSKRPCAALKTDAQISTNVLQNASKHFSCHSKQLHAEDTMTKASVEKLIGVQICAAFPSAAPFSRQRFSARKPAASHVATALSLLSNPHESKPRQSGENGFLVTRLLLEVCCSHHQQRDCPRQQGCHLL